MTPSETIRHNARLIRQHVCGKSKAERRECYALLSAGPIGLMLKAVDIILKASQPITVNVVREDRDIEFNRHFDAIERNILAGARPRFDGRRG